MLGLSNDEENVTTASNGDARGEHTFLERLVEAIPCGVVVVDRHRRVVAASACFESTFGIEPGTAIGPLGSQLFACREPVAGLPDCGDSSCASCEARGLVRETLNGAGTARARVSFPVTLNGVAEDLEVMIKAAPFEFNGENYVVMVFDDLGEVAAVRRRAADHPGLHGIIGRHPKVLELLEAIRSVAPTEAPVLLLGESGTGKELAAIALHRESSRSDRLLVPVHCAALAEGVLESELFGHVKGAFTGAIRDKKGRFELAHGGTIFLDEIGELSPSMQIKLLRVLQDGTFERVGSEQTIKVDARVICATNRDLASEVASGNFRSDLFYRLGVFPITMPPLRERESDIPLLAAHLLALAADNGGRRCPGLSAGALAVLRRHIWPGNVRELDNALRYALIKSAGGTIRPEHLPGSVLGAVDEASAQRAARPRKLVADSVVKALQAAGGNKVVAARLLGVGRATLYRFLADQEHQLSNA
jgi:transcriptional regulator with PAS, ATPase and Fis domain